MKPQEMDQEKLLNWMKTYLERSKKDLEAMREAFYDFVDAGLDEQAEQQLKEMVVKQGVHVTLLGELLEAEEYRKMMLLVQKMAANAPEA